MRKGEPWRGGGGKGGGAGPQTSRGRSPPLQMPQPCRNSTTSSYASPRSGLWHLPLQLSLLRPNTATLCLTLVSHIHLRPPVSPTCSTQGQSAHLLHSGPLGRPSLRRPPGVPPQQSQLRPQSARALWGSPTLAHPVSSHWRVQRDRPPCCSQSSWTCPGHTLSLGHQGSSLPTDLNSRSTFSMG